MIFIAELWRSLRKMPFIQQYTALDTLSNVLLLIIIHFKQNTPYNVIICQQKTGQAKA